MKSFDWSKDKSELLKRTRGISFDDVADAIEKGALVDNIEHPDPGRHPNQKVYIIIFRKYAYAVPYVEDGSKIFFKTIYPSRIYTKKYLNDDSK